LRENCLSPEKFEDMLQCCPLVCRQRGGRIDVAPCSYALPARQPQLWVPPGVHPPGGADKISCPFVKMVLPSTESMESFLATLEGHGQEMGLAEAISRKMFKAQFGKGVTEAARLGERTSIDIYNLHLSIPNDDLYLSFFDEVRSRASALTASGADKLITYADTVALKRKLVAPRSGTQRITKPSVTRTRILFLRAGGNVTSGFVFVDDWLRLLQGLVPISTGFVVKDGEPGFVSKATQAQLVENLESDLDLWCSDDGGVKADTCE